MSGGISVRHVCIGAPYTRVRRSGSHAATERPNGPAPMMAASSSSFRVTGLGGMEDGGDGRRRESGTDARATLVVSGEGARDSRPLRGLAVPPATTDAARDPD